jgi:hypothetical protein
MPASAPGSVLQDRPGGLGKIFAAGVSGVPPQAEETPTIWRFQPRTGPHTEPSLQARIALPVCAFLPGNRGRFFESPRAKSVARTMNRAIFPAVIPAKAGTQMRFHARGEAWKAQEQ